MVDEPEPEAAPLITAAGGTVDADDTEVTVDRMTKLQRQEFGGGAQRETIFRLGLKPNFGALRRISSVM